MSYQNDRGYGGQNSGYRNNSGGYQRDNNRRPGGGGYNNNGNRNGNNGGNRPGLVIKVDEINEDSYVDLAEKVMTDLVNGGDKKILTTTQIRNLLAMADDIYNDVLTSESDVLNSEIKSRIEYMRVHFVYESGRTPEVKKFIDKTSLIDLLKNVKGDKKKYILFNHYLEALVAYHRFEGGKD